MNEETYYGGPRGGCMAHQTTILESGEERSLQVFLLRPISVYTPIRDTLGMGGVNTGNRHERRAARAKLHHK